jgi:hypothetical protein
LSEKIGSDVSDFFQIGAGVQTEVRAAQNNSNLKAYWSSAQALSLFSTGSRLPRLGRLRLPIGFPQALAPQETNTQRFSDSSATTNSPEPPLPLASAVASHSPSLSGAARPPRKGTGPGAALPDTFIEPDLATWAQLADLSFLNHCASTSIEIPLSCDWISGSFFSVGIGSQRTPFIQDRTERRCSTLHWGYHRSGARYFTAAKKRSPFIGGKALSPQAAPILLVAAGSAMPVTIAVSKSRKRPFWSSKPVHFLSITKMISAIVAECLL